LPKPKPCIKFYKETIYPTLNDDGLANEKELAAYTELLSKATRLRMSSGKADVELPKDHANNDSDLA
jgi:hypothetical protein